MDIYYRLSDKGRRSNKPDYISIENCLRNFLNHFSDYCITIIADNCSDETIELIHTITQGNKIKVLQTSLGNSASFVYTVNYILRQPLEDDTIIYLVEDDYLHLDNSAKILQEGFKYADYVTLYDHPDKYNPFVCDGGEETTVFLTEHSHWKLTKSTTMTFACRVKTLREDCDVLSKYCSDEIPDDINMFCELLKNGRN